MARKLLTTLTAALLIPYIVTLAWTGAIAGQEPTPDLTSGRRVLLDRGEKNTYVDAEEYVVGVVAKQIPPDYGMEVLKAQAVIARTYVYKQMGDSREIPESALDIDYLEEAQLKELWGSDHFVVWYKDIKQAVDATKGQVLSWDGKLIDPLFHRASTGKTRDGDANHPYLASVDCAEDIQADNYLTIFLFSKEDLAERINSIPDGGGLTRDQLPDSIQMISRDAAGYVTQIQAGTRTYTGEEIQYALSLPSASFTLEPYGDDIRAVVKGIGHGYGFSQFAAKRKAEAGMTAEELLTYFYKNIQIISV